MKIRTTLGIGVAAAAVASSVLGVTTPAHATPVTPWNTQVGDFGIQTSGLVASGTTAYAVLSPSYDATTDSPIDPAVVPVDLSTGAAGTPTTFPASSLFGLPAISGDTVAVAGYDPTNSSAPTVWDVTGGSTTAIVLANAYSIGGIATTATGFLAVGNNTDGCLTTWTWAPGDTSATAGDAHCSISESLTPSAIAVEPGTGTVYAAVTGGVYTQTPDLQLWNLSDFSAAPITVSTDTSPYPGAPSGMTVGADGTVYIAAQDTFGDGTAQVATVDPTGTNATTVRGTGIYAGAANQVALVNGQLWLGSYQGIAVLDPAATTTYTSEAPAPTLSTDNNLPQFFAIGEGADYALVPSDAAFDDGTSNLAPGLQQIVAPDAPVPSAVAAGSTATVSWDAVAASGAPVITATVVPTNTDTNGELAPVTAAVDVSAPSVDVPGLTPGDHYTFAVTQGNGWFDSASASTAAVLVKLPATPKPSKVAVSGKTIVGTKLTITTTGSWGSGAVLQHAWYAGTTKVGTGAAYTLKAADAGKKVKVVVTGTSAGHSPSSVTSAYVGPVTKPVYVVPNKPTITGILKVGKILTAHITGLPSNATVKYQWAYNAGQSGGPIGSRTTSNTLKIPASVRHDRLMVIVYVAVPGYQTGSKASALTGTIS